MSNRGYIQACDWSSMIGVHPFRGMALSENKTHQMLKYEAQRIDCPREVAILERCPYQRGDSTQEVLSVLEAFWPKTRVCIRGISALDRSLCKRGVYLQIF